MKELNERQRADHSSRMYNQIKSTVEVLENRNTELEQKFAEVTDLCTDITNNSNEKLRPF